MKTRILKVATIAMIMITGAAAARALDGAVIANESVPAASLSADDLKNILTGKTKYWDGGEAIVIVYVEKGADGPLKEASGKSPSAFKTFWQRLAFSGRGQAPKKAKDVAAAVALVSSTKGAMAVVTSDAPTDGVKKIEIQ